uniref:SH3 domain-containing protein n=1 Tax=Paenirhodobacter enshiensis TaxID=1105367 RepID=UPI0035B41990
MTHSTPAPRRGIFLPALAAGLIAACLAGTAHAQDAEDDTAMPADLDASMTLESQENRGAVTNLPLPRYVSLKGSDGNARRGPSLSHRIDWVFKHAGMPLKVTAEFGNWRRIEDRDGAGGWIHYTLLSGVRTVVFEDDHTELHSRPDDKAPVTAYAEAGAIAKLGKCSVEWCDVSSKDADGWVRKTKVWGVDAQETRD